MVTRHRGAQPNASLVGDVRVGPRARVMWRAVLDDEIVG